MTTIIKMIEVIHQHLDENTTDWVARLQLADLLDEAGKNIEARYQRWAVQHERAPSLWCNRPEKLLPWHWWTFKRDHHCKACLGVRLARAVLDYNAGFSTRKSAELALLYALQDEHWPAPEIAFYE